MLQTTVNYLSLLENKRHNLVTEGQTDKQIAISQGELEIHRGQLEETHRHNVETESLGWASLYETQRHNVVTEGINEYDANTRRANLDIGWYNAATNRYAAEQQAGIGWANVSIGSYNAETQRTRALNDYEIAQQNAHSNSKQAEAAITNATTRASELTERQWKDQLDVENKQRELDQKAEMMPYEKFDIIYGNIIKGVSAGGTLLRGASSMFQVLGGM